MPVSQQRVKIITDPTKLPEPVRRHLEYRLNEDSTRQLTPHELAQLAWWIRGNPTAPNAHCNWYKDFGTFYAVGHGELWKSVLTSRKNFQGMWVRMRPKEGDVRLASLLDVTAEWLDSHPEWKTAL